MRAKSQKKNKNRREEARRQLKREMISHTTPVDSQNEAKESSSKKDIDTGKRASYGSCFKHYN